MSSVYSKKLKKIVIALLLSIFFINYLELI